MLRAGSDGENPNRHVAQFQQFLSMGFNQRAGGCYFKHPHEGCRTNSICPDDYIPVPTQVTGNSSNPSRHNPVDLSVKTK